jgi:hypothetical protein
MALALTAYEDSLCPGCGLPHAKTHGDGNVGRYETVADDICHGCEALETLQANDKRESFPGQKIHLHEVDGFD